MGDFRAWEFVVVAKNDDWSFEISAIRSDGVERKIALIDLSQAEAIRDGLVREIDSLLSSRLKSA